MKGFFSKEQIFTLPNLLSLVRLALIPLIIHLYCVKQEYTAAVMVILLSGITDVMDGIIARKSGRVTDLGKILDPVADKLTQGAIIICLAAKYRGMYWLIAAFVLKELVMIILGYVTIKKKGQVNSAKWFGKAATVLLYVAMSLLILFPGIPAGWANVMIVLCGVVIGASLMLYIRFYMGILKESAMES